MVSLGGKERIEANYCFNFMYFMYLKLLLESAKITLSMSSIRTKPFPLPKIKTMNFKIIYLEDIFARF